MHFANQHHGNGSQVSKFALVAGLHVLVAFGVINMTNSKVFSTPKEPPPVNLPPLKPVEPPKPIDPPALPKQIAPPVIVVPKIEIDIEPPPVENPVRATPDVMPKQDPHPATPTGVTPAPDVKPVAKPGGMRSAVLADANSCAKPNYPAAAARNGDSGTVVLALLVGTNGRVSDARVTKSSGYRDLDKAAVNALSLCQFKPALNDGVPEAGWAQIAYVWSLED